MEQVGK